MFYAIAFAVSVVIWEAVNWIIERAYVRFASAERVRESFIYEIYRIANLYGMKVMGIEEGQICGKCSSNF